MDNVCYAVGINERLKMTSKEKVNERLEELYDLVPRIGKIYIIDDWNMLMPLALKNKIGFVAMNNNLLAGRDSIQIVQHYSDHESPQAAARYAIAMALIELAESE